MQADAAKIMGQDMAAMRKDIEEAIVMLDAAMGIEARRLLGAILIRRKNQQIATAPRGS